MTTDWLEKNWWRLPTGKSASVASGDNVSAVSELAPMRRSAAASSRLYTLRAAETVAGPDGRSYSSPSFSLRHRSGAFPAGGLPFATTSKARTRRAAE
jgi:hypothetical protein